ncbi:MAG: hypothetical protein H6872_04445 [Methylobacteriaceae bacterium]|nr:hypothetical protein [Methylobacteriaceae bacterium]
MDDTIDIESHAKLGAAESASATGAFHPEIQDSGRNAVFASLVKGDSDITGLVAYSIFKQNELDWLQDFRTAKGREPSEGEADSYIIGESTPRRLATYRHLADATLSGKGPDVANGGPSAPRAVALQQQQPAKQSGGFGMSAVVYFILTLVLLVAVYYSARYGVPKIGG